MIKHIPNDRRKHIPWLEYYRVGLLENTSRRKEWFSWCVDNIKSDEWCCSKGREVFYFKNKSAAVLFTLRWEGDHDGPD